MQKIIYAADDEENIRNLIKTFLEDAGYTVEIFDTGDALFEAFLKKSCDLVVLDVMMPGSDGLTVCRNLREHSTVPIIILTAKESEMDYALGIHCGGDDYLTKPFRPSLLAMRIKALLRRVDMERQSSTSWEYAIPNERLVFGDLEYRQQEHSILSGSTPLPLTATEFALLAYMLRYANRPISRDELLHSLWGFPAEVETRVTDETIRRVRKKMAVSGSLVQIRTEWGFGYRLVDTAEKTP